MSYVCAGKKFQSLGEAKAFAEWAFKSKGIVLGIERKKRVTKAEKLAAAAKQIRLNRAIYGFQIPMLSIPALYRLLEVAADDGQTDAELKAIVARYPGVKESLT